MTTLVLAAYLILVGVIELLNIPVAQWVTGLLALIAGILLLVGSPLVGRYIHRV